MIDSINKFWISNEDNWVLAVITATTATQPFIILAIETVSIAQRGIDFNEVSWVKRFKQDS